MKLTTVAGGMLLFLSNAALADDIDLTPDYTPREVDPFQQALENPIQPPEPPTAMEMLEQGRIPSNENPMPPPGGFGADFQNGTPTITYSDDF